MDRGQVGHCWELARHEGSMDHGGDCARAREREAEEWEVCCSNSAGGASGWACWERGPMGRGLERESGWGWSGQPRGHSWEARESGSEWRKGQPMGDRRRNGSVHKGPRDQMGQKDQRRDERDQWVCSCGLWKGQMSLWKGQMR